MLTFQDTGALLFGIVVGWVAYRTLRRSSGSAISDIATVLGAVGGASVTGLFPAKTDLFASYCFGLTAGFFGYLITAIILSPKGQAVSEWLGDPPGPPRVDGGSPGTGASGGGGGRGRVPDYTPQ
jgi:hypothetical protein